MLQRGAATIVACFVLFVAAAGTGTASAQSPDDAIGAIRFEGNQRIEPETIQSYLALREGEPFDPDRLDRSLRDLFATGLFNDVNLRREGDTLVVAVTENPVINRIAFEGNLRVEDMDLENEIQLRPRVVYTRARVQNAVERVLEVYRRNGRYAATVQPQVIELPENRVDVVFEINEGPLTRVERIVFIGNETFGSASLRGVIQTRESAWYRFLTSDDTYDPDRLAFDQELLRRFYRSQGYADFQVRSALAELTPDGTGFFITFTVDEGPRYAFGDVDVRSNLRDVRPERLRELVQTREGEVFNADQVEATVVALTERLGELGYAFVRVEPVAAVDREARTIGVNYVLDEGPRVYVERIDIVGNVRTLDSVVRREMRLAEGDAFNTVLLRRSQQRIQNLGFFERVDVQQLEGSAPDRTVIRVEVVEQSTGELSFGAGFSTQDGLLGDVRLNERNLLGRGQDLEIGFTASGRRQEANLSFTEPYFLGYEFAAGFDLFRRTTDFQDESSFDERDTGVRLRGSYPLTEFLRHEVRYTLRRDEITDRPDDASVFILAEDDDVVSSIIGQSFVYDRRDTPFLPSRGYLLRVDQDVAVPGGDTRFVRHEGLASYYYPFTADTVLNLAARGGYLFGYGGEDVRLSDRFFIGGTTLRGFTYGGVGPRDTETDDALGGNAYAVGSAELRFPLGLPEDLRLFGRSFVEGGTLTDVDLDGPTLRDNADPRLSVGVGLSWVSPLGPIAIDVAQAVLKDQDDETELFRLSFGTRF